MTEPAIASDVHQSLDVHLYLLAQVAFDGALLIDDGPNAIDLLFGQFSHFPICTDSGLRQYVVGPRAPYSVNVG